MTIKEKLETIKGKKIAILVENEEQDDVLVNALNLITHEDCIGFYLIEYFFNIVSYSTVSSTLSKRVDTRKLMERRNGLTVMSMKQY